MTVITTKRDSIRMRELLSLFIELAGLGVWISFLRYLVHPSDWSSGLMISFMSLVAATVAIGCCYRYWPHIREQLVVFPIFSGFGVLLMHLIDGESSNFSELAVTAGASAGVAGSISWMFFCNGQRSQSHANWLMAELFAGLLCHPLLWLYAVATGEISLVAFAIVVCLGVLFWGIPTVTVGLAAAATCRFVLGRIFGRKQVPASNVGAF